MLNRVMGRIRQTKNSGNAYWSNLLYGRNINDEEESDSDLPTVTTDEVEAGFSLNANATGTVVSEGSSDIISYGFVWAEHDDPTVEDEVVEVGTGSFTGEFDTTINSLALVEFVYVAAYATNSSGTAYGEVFQIEPQICLAEGTLISTLYGPKKIEDIDYEENLITWNFDDGEMTFSKPVWMVEPFVSSSCATVTFSNGEELTTVNDGKGHRIFNLEKGMFTHLMSDDTPIGTNTYTNELEVVQVVAKRVEKTKTKFYNVIANKHINVFANGILTSTGLNNLYPIVDMKFIKDNRTLRSPEEFMASDELFEGLRLAEQPLDYPNLINKINRMVNRRYLQTCSK